MLMRSVGKLQLLSNCTIIMSQYSPLFSFETLASVDLHFVINRYIASAALDYLTRKTHNTKVVS